MKTMIKSDSVEEVRKEVSGSIISVTKDRWKYSVQVVDGETKQAPRHFHREKDMKRYVQDLSRRLSMPLRAEKKRDHKKTVSTQKQKELRIPGFEAVKPGAEPGEEEVIGKNKD